MSSPDGFRVCELDQFHPLHKELEQVEFEFTSWSELLPYLLSPAWNRWIFRGMSDYSFWPESSLERHLKTLGIDRSSWREHENRAIGFFKTRARQCLRNIPEDRNVTDWLSLMQHYGAPTRLVDWTFSPLVACYFAYEDAAPKDRALWLLNPDACRSSVGSPTGYYRDHIGAVPSLHTDGETVRKSYPGLEMTDTTLADFDTALLREAIEHDVRWPFPIAIFSPDERMIAQQACFVVTGAINHEMSAFQSMMKKDSLAAIRRELSKVKETRGFIGAGHSSMLQTENGIATVDFLEYPGYYLRKIRLPNAWRSEVLFALNKMNITAETLFPGLDGCGRSTRVNLGLHSSSSLQRFSEMP